jgi:hypothetical protein
MRLAEVDLVFLEKQEQQLIQLEEKVETVDIDEGSTHQDLKQHSGPAVSSPMYIF